MKFPMKYIHTLRNYKSAGTKQFFLILLRYEEAFLSIQETNVAKANGNIGGIIYPSSFKYPVPTTSKYPAATTTVTTTIAATTAASDLNYQPYTSAHVRRQSLQMQLSQRGSPVKEFSSPTNHSTPPSNHFCHVLHQQSRPIHQSHPNHDSCGQISTALVEKEVNGGTEQVQNSSR